MVVWVRGHQTPSTNIISSRVHAAFWSPSASGDRLIRQLDLLGAVLVVLDTEQLPSRAGVYHEPIVSHTWEILLFRICFEFLSSLDRRRHANVRRALPLPDNVSATSQNLSFFHFQPRAVFCIALVCCSFARGAVIGYPVPHLQSVHGLLGADSSWDHTRDYVQLLLSCSGRQKCN